MTVDGAITGEIGAGLLVLLGVTHTDTEADADRLAEKVRALRVFADDQGRMNEPLGAPRGPVHLAVHALRRHPQGQPPGLRGRGAAGAGRAAVRALLRARLGAERGVFGAHMAVELVNDGPVTVMLEVATAAST